ncbi:hypothetical protein [Paenibacillus lutrae]|uniref:Uncharacterized protein n=1 Tax=Paenibacillus lutrae TaxID=2078573 RepID=A0A7X3FIN0_9BACL|nr:hypothetical protein [Paenibacillus lutrae]MVP00479.1 hypothetical protein [Paenibacillus lutrae]
MSRTYRIVLWTCLSLLVLVVAGRIAVDRISEQVLRSAVSEALETSNARQAEKEGASSVSSDPGSSASQIPPEHGAEAAGDAPSSHAPPITSADPASPAKDRVDQNGAPSGQTPPASASSREEDKGRSASSSDSGKTAGSGSDRASISADQAEKVSGEISWTERAKVVSVMVKRLNPSDMKQLSHLLRDGVSREEKKKAKEIILTKLSQEEYDELIAIASKYGLSKGKSYQKSLQEQKQE